MRRKATFIIIGLLSLAAVYFTLPLFENTTVENDVAEIGEETTAPVAAPINNPRDVGNTDINNKLQQVQENRNRLASRLEEAVPVEEMNEEYEEQLKKLEEEANELEEKLRELQSNKYNSYKGE